MTTKYMAFRKRLAASAVTAILISASPTWAASNTKGSIYGEAKAGASYF